MFSINYPPVGLLGMFYGILQQPCYSEKPFFLLLGKSVVIQHGAGLTFAPFVGATFISFVEHSDFVSQQMKSVGVGGNYTSFVVAPLLFLKLLAAKSVGGTF